MRLGATPRPRHVCVRSTLTTPVGHLPSWSVHLPSSSVHLSFVVRSSFLRRPFIFLRRPLLLSRGGTLLRRASRCASSLAPSARCRPSRDLRGSGQGIRHRKDGLQRAARQHRVGRAPRQRQLGGRSRGPGKQRRRGGRRRRRRGGDAAAHCAAVAVAVRGRRDGAGPALARRPVRPLRAQGGASSAVRRHRHHDSTRFFLSFVRLFVRSLFRSFVLFHSLYGFSENSFSRNDKMHALSSACGRHSEYVLVARPSQRCPPLRRVAC